MELVLEVEADALGKECNIGVAVEEEAEASGEWRDNK